MSTDDPQTDRPKPKPPATGADAWKNRPTSCWPTPATTAQNRRAASPLVPPSESVAAPSETEEATEAESGWETDGGAEETEPVPMTPASSPSDERDDVAEPQSDVRAPLASAPEIPARFRQTVARLDELPARPVSEHADGYDSVHRELREALDDVDRHG